MGIRVKWNSIKNHLQRKTEIEKSFGLTLCFGKTGKLLFKLVWKNFPKNHRFRKIFSLNTLKVSYSSMSNLQSLENNTTVMF